MTDILNWVHLQWPNIFCLHSTPKYFKLKPENDVRGNVEYKRTLVNCTPKRIQSYTTQMLWRIMQSKKQRAVYYIGVDDNGTSFGLNDKETKATIKTFMEMVSSINAIVTKMHLMSIQSKYIIQFKIKIKQPLQIFYDF